MPLPQLIEILSRVTPKTLESMQKPSATIADLKKSLAASDSRNAKISKELASSKSTNAGINSALTAAREQNTILQERLASANTLLISLRSELQTVHKQKQHLHYLAQKLTEQFLSTRSRLESSATQTLQSCTMSIKIPWLCAKRCVTTTWTASARFTCCKGLMLPPLPLLQG